ncbi:MAG: general secretion pathway protein GspC [Legionella sp.]|nr:general secretion pathway protein GspC [Legionella sp.]
MKFDPQLMFSTKYAGRTSTVLILLFLILILYQLASYFFANENAALLTPVSQNTQRPVKKESTDYLKNSSLFGVYVPENVNEVIIKKSMLDLTLVGILLANKVADSQVIIRSAGGTEKNYKLGDTLPGGVLLKRITSQGILVEHEGKLESITLPKDELLFEPVSKPLKEEESQ